MDKKTNDHRMKFYNLHKLNVKIGDNVQCNRIAHCLNVVVRYTHSICTFSNIDGLDTWDQWGLLLYQRNYNHIKQIIINSCFRIYEI
jgi:ribosome-interacting GTPase 1